jgi:cell shape-determining protein MreD
MILLIYLVILSAYFNVALAMTIAFFLGIVKNMWFGETIGSASLLYICIVYAVHLYKRKFNARAAGFLFFASIAVIMLAEVIDTRSVSFSDTQIARAFITTFVIVLLFKIVFTIWAPPDDERKLPV